VSGRLVWCSKEIRTDLVIAVSGEGNHVGADGSALHGNVGRADICGSEGCESAGDGECVEEHIEWIMGLV
jgi:hypothetical protein